MLTRVDPRQIASLFPLEDLPPPTWMRDDTDGHLAVRLRHVQETLVRVKVAPKGQDSDEAPLHMFGNVYRQHRDERELDETAKAFYGKAGNGLYSIEYRIFTLMCCPIAELAGVSTKALVAAVLSVERMWEKWAKSGVTSSSETSDSKPSVP